MKPYEHFFYPSAISVSALIKSQKSEGQKIKISAFFRKLASALKSLKIQFTALHFDSEVMDLLDRNDSFGDDNLLQSFYTDLPDSIDTIIYDAPFLRKNNNISQILICKITSNIKKLGISGNAQSDTDFSIIGEAFAVIPAHITSLVMYGRWLCNIQQTKLIDILNRIPNTITSVTLSISPIVQTEDPGRPLEKTEQQIYTNIIVISADDAKHPNFELTKSVFALPLTVTTLDLRANCLGKLDSGKIIYTIHGIPSSVTSLILSHNSMGASVHLRDMPVPLVSLDFSYNMLYSGGENDLPYFLDNLPLTLTDLNLRGNYLGQVTFNILITAFRSFAENENRKIISLNLGDNISKESDINLSEFFAVMDRSVTSLDFSDNNLGPLSKKIDLVQAFKNLPNLLSLNLNNNNLGMCSYLNNFFDALPKSMTVLDLSYNDLGQSTLHTLFSTLPNLTSLNLSGNKLAHLTQDYYTHLPSSLTTLDLRNNKLEENENKLAEIFSALPDNVNTVYLDTKKYDRQMMRELIEKVSRNNLRNSLLSEFKSAYRTDSVGLFKRANLYKESRNEDTITWEEIIKHAVKSSRSCNLFANSNRTYRLLNNMINQGQIEVIDWNEGTVNCLKRY